MVVEAFVVKVSLALAATEAVLVAAAETGVAAVVVAVVAAGAALSVVAVGDCANATVVSSAVPARPATIVFIMLSSPSTKNSCGENSADHAQFRARGNFVARCECKNFARVFLRHSVTFCDARFPADDHTPWVKHDRGEETRRPSVAQVSSCSQGQLL